MTSRPLPQQWTETTRLVANVLPPSFCTVLVSQPRNISPQARQHERSRQSLTLAKQPLPPLPHDQQTTLTTLLCLTIQLEYPHSSRVDRFYIPSLRHEPTRLIRQEYTSTRRTIHTNACCIPRSPQLPALGPSELREHQFDHTIGTEAHSPRWPTYALPSLFSA